MQSACLEPEVDLEIRALEVGESRRLAGVRVDPDQLPAHTRIQVKPAVRSHGQTLLVKVVELATGLLGGVQAVFAHQQ